MIVLTDGKDVIMTYNDTEWNDNAKYADHANNGITHAFRCNPTLVRNTLIETNQCMHHDDVAAVAVEEVNFTNEYT